MGRGIEGTKIFKFIQKWRPIVISMKKQTFGLHLGKVRLQKAYALSDFIGRIGLIFNQKDRFLDFFIRSVYGFCDLQYS